MGYTNSPLVVYTKLSPNHSGQRTHSIDRITPHCVVGQLSAESICGCFTSPTRQASCNYGIGTDGRVSLCVEEKNRSWCSSSNSNDQRAVTIECASDMNEPYAMNSAVYNSLVKLCIDICKRNGKKKLLWLGDKNKTLNYAPAESVRAGLASVLRAGALVPVLATVGFRVVMYDNREELAKKENYPMASEVIFGSFSDISGKVALTANDYAVVMTPGHQADYEILSQVLGSDATYIGCIGSRTKVAKTRERLKCDGYTEEDIARVHAPIGLPILAETPEEIAISIAAEMIEHRARLAGQRH